MKVISVNRVYLAVIQMIFWSYIPNLSEGKCPNLIKVRKGPEFSKPYAEHIYPLVAQFCHTDSDANDNGLVTFPIWIQQLSDDAGFEPTRRAIFDELLIRFNAEVAKRPITKEEIQRTYCSNTTFNADDLERFVDLHDVYLAINTDNSGSQSLNATDIFEMIPERDNVTNIGAGNLCRETRLPKCPTPSRCGPLTNVTEMPVFFVGIIRYLCGVMINDVEINNDPEVAKLFEFDDLKKDCQNEDFFYGISCIPYNKTLRNKIHVIYRAYIKNKEVYNVHARRIGRSLLLQISQFAQEVEKARGFKMKLEGGDCSKSLDVYAARDTFINYVNQSADGSFPFDLLAHWETTQFNFTREPVIQEFVRNSCNFTLGLFCNDKCVCECPKGKGKCKTSIQGLPGKSSDLLNNLAVLIGLVILGLTCWIVFPTF